MAKENKSPVSKKVEDIKPEDKRKALETALTQIKKQFGEGAVMRLGQNNGMHVDAISTGSLSLDLALGIGGLPRGRIIEIYGPESSGKTTLALHCVAEGQKMGGNAAFIDVEHALDPVYASALGVDVETNMVIGKTLTIDELFDMGYEAVFIGSGAGLPMFMNIPGENLKGVYSANEFLTRINLMKAYREDSDTPIMHGKRVAVVGGGNVAMDAARCARRLGAEVKIVYRRSESELPARREEVEHAKEEGIEFCLLTTPLSIKGDDKFSVCAMNCQKMELGEPDASGRRRPIPVEGSEYDIDVDCVIMALGTSPNPLIKSTTKGLEVNRKGGIIVEEATGKTSRDAVYAGGDAVTGAATVISAMGAGKTAAKAIDEYLANK